MSLWYKFLNLLLTSSSEKPTMFCLGHIVTLLLSIVSIVLLVFIHNKINKKAYKIILICIWSSMIVFEALKLLCGSLNSDYDNIFHGYYRFDWGYFPFQLCSLALYLLPFIIFLKDSPFKNRLSLFIVLFNSIGGTMGVIFPTLSKNYFLCFHNFYYHWALLFTGVLIAFKNKEEFKFIKFIQSFSLIFVFIFIAQLLNLIMPLIVPDIIDGIDEFNMFYISWRYKCQFPVLSLIWGTEPWRYILFFISYLFAVALGSFIVYSIYSLAFTHKVDLKIKGFKPINVIANNEIIMGDTKKNSRFVSWWLSLKILYKGLIIGGCVVAITLTFALPLIFDEIAKIPVIHSITNSDYKIFEYDETTNSFKPSTKNDIKVYTINNSSVGYFDINYYVDYFLVDKKGDKYCTFSMKDNVATLTNMFTNSTCDIDYKKQTITYKNVSAFFQNENGLAMPMIEVMSESDYLFVEPVKDTSTFIKGKSEKVIELNKYHLSAYFDKNTCYLPYSLCDILFSFWQGNVPFFNGKNFYKYEFNNDAKYLSPLKTIKDSATIYNKEYMNYAYNALALTFDFRYGLRGRHWRSDKMHNHNYFVDGGFYVLRQFKRGLKSLKQNESNNAFIALFNEVANDGGHSEYCSLSPLCDKVATINSTLENEMVSTSNIDLTIARNEAITMPDEQQGFYQEVSTSTGEKVAFVSIDSLHTPIVQPTPSNINENNYYKSAETTIYWANKKIKENNIKNVVLDMSLNVGGAASIAAFIASWALRKPIEYKIRNTIDNSFLTGTVKANADLEEGFNQETDYLPACVEKVSCISSYSTFSSGNYLVTLLDDFDTDKKIKFIGANSMGGSCNALSGVSNHLGSTMTFSGNYSLDRVESNIDNYVNDEDGIRREFAWDLSCYGNNKECDKYYDRVSIANKVITL